MPHRRRAQKGSFSGHFDELVAQFPAGEREAQHRRSPEVRPSKLQEKIDIHALLFERAWQLEGDR